LFDWHNKGFFLFLKKVYELIRLVDQVNKSKINIVNEPVNEPVNELVNNRQKGIIRLIEKNKIISINELAGICNVGRETVKRDFKKLKELNLIKRVGTDKTGRWELVK
jgi:ATP-dependent DNA helicase RecG